MCLLFSYKISSQKLGTISWRCEEGKKGKRTEFLYPSNSEDCHLVGGGVLANFLQSYTYVTIEEKLFFYVYYKENKATGSTDGSLNCASSNI